MSRRFVRSLRAICAAADSDLLDFEAVPKTRGSDRLVRVEMVFREWTGARSRESSGVVVLSAADQLRLARLLLQAQGIPVPAALGRAIRAASKVKP